MARRRNFVQSGFPLYALLVQETDKDFPTFLTVPVIGYWVDTYNAPEDEFATYEENKKWTENKYPLCDEHDKANMELDGSFDENIAQITPVMMRNQGDMLVPDYRDGKTYVRTTTFPDGVKVPTLLLGFISSPNINGDEARTLRGNYWHKNDEEK